MYLVCPQVWLGRRSSRGKKVVVSFADEEHRALFCLVPLTPMNLDLPGEVWGWSGQEELTVL
jgi:hypothetical protein